MSRFLWLLFPLMFLKHKRIHHKPTCSFRNLPWTSPASPPTQWFWALVSAFNNPPLSPPLSQFPLLKVSFFKYEPTKKIFCVAFYRKLENEDEPEEDEEVGQWCQSSLLSLDKNHHFLFWFFLLMQLLLLDLQSFQALCNKIVQSIHIRPSMSIFLSFFFL